MDLNMFKEVIDYAIDKEWEAVEFYAGLQNEVKLEASALFLKELELMERGHVKILEQIKLEEVKNFVPKNINNLKIAELMVSPKINDEMSFQDVMTIAIKREQAAYNLYKTLAEESQNDTISNIFNKLAEEELKHKLNLETVYDDEFLKEN